MQSRRASSRFTVDRQQIEHSTSSAARRDVRGDGRRARALVKQAGRDSIVVNDSPGFVTNRVMMLMVNEAMFLVHEGVASVQDVDRLFKTCFGHKMGPLETADLIGLDTVLRSLEVHLRELNDSKYRPCPLLKRWCTPAQRTEERQGFLRLQHARDSQWVTKHPSPRIRTFMSQTRSRAQTSPTTDDIFALGFANSLFAMQLVAFVERQFGIEIEQRGPGDGQLPQHPGDLRAGGAEAGGTHGHEHDLADRVEDLCRAFAAERVAPLRGADRPRGVDPAATSSTPSPAPACSRADFRDARRPADVGRRPGEAAAIRHGLLHEALGYASASVQGSGQRPPHGRQPDRPVGLARAEGAVDSALARGEMLAAIAITEPNVGSDAAAVETTATR